MHQARKPTGYTGIANLPNQIYRKAVLKGFEFNIMVVGASGLGKSTFINSLFQSDVYNSYTKATAGSKSTVSIETTTLKLKEGAVNLSLRLVDTPDLKDVTHNVLYENYRMRKLCDLKKEGKMSKNYFVEYEKEKLNHEAKLRRIEVELENILGEKVMESALEVERRELDENRKRFELEKKKWEESKMTRTFY
ncbi:hypothetical protein NQ315_003351 [Exocentrus adspersus]|uniref:Septin-type G domain-containing protein n=1 Tax=Exocentrus adspersus TaxID=1586481 RepID=A0AAV8VDL6_9CUCU|nr:hypothetical protein NQ315_003351 [Exocentrus adspersus]